VHAASHRERYDREYPHQVLALAETLRGKVLDRVIDFHMNLGIPVPKVVQPANWIRGTTIVLQIPITPNCSKSCSAGKIVQCN
jgi:hypothetical protein